MSDVILAKASLNGSGESHASGLVSNGKVDKTSSWGMSADDENRILGDPPNWTEYGKWHLGVDGSQGKDTKGHWKYPFGKGGKVYRSGLIAIKQRAGQQGDTEVGNAAGRLLERVDGKKDESTSGNVLRFNSTKGFEIRAKDDKKAEIYLYDSIGSGFFGGISADRFVKELNALGKCKEIALYVNSDGGDVFEGFTIYQNLVRHPASINVHVDGLAASISSVIAMAGNRICMSDVGMMMIHDPWSMAVGSAVDLRKRADTLDQIRGSIVRVYSNRTKQTEEKCSQMMASETWMDATQALELGFATEVAEPQLMAASASGYVCGYDLTKFRNAPSWWGRAPLEQPKLVALRAKRGQLFVLE